MVKRTRIISVIGLFLTLILPGLVVLWKMILFEKLPNPGVLIIVGLLAVLGGVLIAAVVELDDL